MISSPIENQREASGYQQLTADSLALSVAEVSRLSGVSQEDLTGLVDFGVLAPLVSDQGPWAFNTECIPMLQRACTMRDDLALDSHAFALAVMFLQKISGLEAEQRSLKSELLLCRASEHRADRFD